jgi:hypothetical protein
MGEKIMSDDAALIKDRSITLLLKALDLEGHGWVVIDYWEADRCAIGIGRREEGAKEGERKLAYISTWQEPAGRYFVDLDSPAPRDPLGYVTEASVDDCDIGQVIAMLETHLGTPR